MTTDRASDAPAEVLGTHATSPWRMPAAAWWRVLKRTWAEQGSDNIGLIAAGTAFYAFAAIVPLLASIVLIYGLVADTETVVANIRALFSVLPEDAARLIGEQLATVVGTSGGKKGFGLIIALFLALYGATKGASAVVIALNVAYEERETRSFIMTNLLAFAITGGAVLVALTAIASTAAFALIDDFLPWLPGVVLTLINILSYGVLAALVVTAAACLYRFGPDRRKAKWVWLTPGSVIATAIWLGATIGFGFYVKNFGNYGATYGSLSAVIVLLTWLWLSAYVFLLGAELNAEFERQTACDTTVGPAQPIGDRGAAVADHIVQGEDAAPVLPDQPGTVASAAQIGVAARVTGGKAGLPTALLTAGGLSALRRGSPGKGLALLGVGAAIAWTKRDRPAPEPHDAA